MDMIINFPSFAANKELISKTPLARRLISDGLKRYSGNKKYLVAISGGPDSVALTVLVWALGYEIGCAHVNYHLRGRESDGDEAFCRDFCHALDIPLHVHSVHMKGNRSLVGESLQEMARNLRYTFFERISREGGYDHIATAHHLDDSIESFFINLLRGTGIDGLTGIPRERGNILRPFTGVKRDEIKAFLDRFAIPYRVDSSNESADYLRNRIRHGVIPQVEEITPAFRSVMGQNLDRLSATSKWLSDETGKWFDTYAVAGEDLVQIDRKGFSPETPVILIYQVFKPYGFQWSEMAKLKNLLLGQSGKSLHSATHELLIDRASVYIRKKQIAGKPEHFTLGRRDLDEGIRVSLPAGIIEGRKLSGQGQDVNGDQDSLYIPESQLSYPLSIRRWRRGDRFQPAGMQGRHQNVSNFLTNRKVGVLEKEAVFVLADANRILWVIGYRKAVAGSPSSSTGPGLFFRYQRQ